MKHMVRIISIQLRRMEIAHLTLKFAQINYRKLKIYEQEIINFD